jgi:hypothetical protein
MTIVGGSYHVLQTEAYTVTSPSPTTTTSASQQAPRTAHLAPTRVPAGLALCPDKRSSRSALLARSQWTRLRRVGRGRRDACFAQA